MFPLSHTQEATKMAELCQQKLNIIFPNLQTDIRGYKEHPHQAVGNGSGIKYGLQFPFIISILKRASTNCVLKQKFFCSLFAETSTGCVFGGSSLGKKTLNIDEVSSQAVAELVDGIKCGGCVDSYTQDQVSSITMLLQLFLKKIMHPFLHVTLVVSM